jgi:hypothetical protein
LFKKRSAQSAFDAALGRRQGEIMRLVRSLSMLAACLVTISGLAGHFCAAAAQQPEKRIALVVGNGAYAK